MEKKTRFAIGISGSGTNMQAIIRSIEAKKLDAEVAFVWADNPDSSGLAWAEKKGHQVYVLDHKKIKKEVLDGTYDGALPEADHINRMIAKCGFVKDIFGNNFAKTFDYFKWKIAAEQELAELVGTHSADTIVLAGYMQLVTPHIVDFMNIDDNMKPEIINIHPSLLPSFSGVDGYGDTFRFGCKVGGCTVHYVDYGEDTGPIIGQATLSILPEDDEESYSNRGLQEEYKIFPQCLKWHIEGKLELEETRLPNGNMRVVVKRYY